MSRSHSILLSIASVLLFGLFSVGLVSAEAQSSLTRFHTGVTVSDFDTYAVEITNLTTQTANLVLVYTDLDGGFAHVAADVVAPMATKLITAGVPLPNGFVGSLTISSDKAITSRGVYRSGGGEAALVSFAEGASTLYVPNIYQNGDFYSALYVHNVSTQPQTVTISMSGTSCSETHQIAPGGTLYSSALADTCTPEGYGGSATVYADGARAGELIASSYRFTRSGNALDGGSNGASTPLAVNLASMTMTETAPSASNVVLATFMLLMVLTGLRARSVLKQA